MSTKPPDFYGYTPPSELWNEARFGAVEVFESEFIERGTLIFIGANDVGAQKAILGIRPRAGVAHDVVGFAHDREELGRPLGWCHLERAYLLEHGGDYSTWLDAVTGQVRVFALMGRGGGSFSAVENPK